MSDNANKPTHEGNTTVYVTGISKETGEKEIRDFFSFCGKIHTFTSGPAKAGGEGQEATVTFEKETAAKTALLLDNTQLGPAQVHVVSVESEKSGATTTSGTATSGTSSSTAADDSAEISQDDKPRARVVAEIISHGYTLSDKAIEQALALDQKHGISQRFTKAISDFDAKFGATEKATAVDQKLGVTGTATSAWQGLNSYFEKAIGTPTGQKLRTFYEQGQKQVVDVHHEARYLADLKAGRQSPSDASHDDRLSKAGFEKHADGSTTCKCGGQDEECLCKPGECACNNCPKSAST